ncbi:MAG: alcohol dehydrogenase catalytic domain-containing protein [Proteobacteria bacterium]|nr:alcohol dehydrogenase catalytic domain-containing protein [Pseudomonadota bacterium]
MRAIKLTGPRKLEMADVETPEKDGEQVLMKISACGICGSDIHYYDIGVGMDSLPGLIMGHEFFGTVEDPGSRTDISVGDRITALPLNPCGTCDTCTNGLSHICLQGMKRPVPGNSSQGAFAEYIKIRPDMVRKLPDTLSDKEAILIEPAAVALHAVRKANIGVGNRVLITGGGPIGLLCAAWARINGASSIVLTEVDPFRKTFASETGDVDEVFDAGDPDLSRILKKFSKGGFDVAMETSANDAGLLTAVSALKSKGRLVIAGINFKLQKVPTLLMTIKELECHGAFAYHPQEFDAAIDFLAKKRLQIEKLITRVIALDEVPEMFETMTKGPSEDIKIMIQP